MREGEGRREAGRRNVYVRQWAKESSSERKPGIGTRMRYQISVAWMGLLLPVSGIIFDFPSTASAYPQKRAISDQTVRGYLTERTCWWNEVCKEEFQTQFRCRCPLWSYCRSPGRYYNAYCSITSTGYTWVQPEHHLGGTSVGYSPSVRGLSQHGGTAGRTASRGSRGGRSGGGPGGGVPLPSFH